MRSFLGSTILQAAALFSITDDLEQAKRDLEKVSGIYVGFNCRILDLSNPDDRLLAIDVDPDVADFKDGYAVLVSA